MAKALIQLAFRQIIDITSSGEMEKKIFRDSYGEFKMKIQAYNMENKFDRFSAIVANDGRANSLHYKTSFAVLHHLEKLANKIPGLQDSVGRFNIPYVTMEFKLIESSVTDISLHKVAVIYISDTMTLVDHFGDHLLLAMGDQSATMNIETIETFLLQVQENLSIVNYKQLAASSSLVLEKMSAS